MSAISNFRIDSLSEGCVNIENANGLFIVDFDRFRKEFREGAFSSLRSVDFVELKENAVFLIEVTDLKETAKSIRKEIKRKDNVQLRIGSYIIGNFLKAEYREKLFESLFLLQLLLLEESVEIIEVRSLEDIKVTFLIVLCNSRPQDVIGFRYLESFLSSLLPENWNCKIILESTFRGRFIRR